jgi:hypothetical protein
MKPIPVNEKVCGGEQSQTEHFAELDNNDFKTAMPSHVGKPEVKGF